MAYTVSVTALKCIGVPLGIGVPGGFFIFEIVELVLFWNKLLY